MTELAHAQLAAWESFYVIVGTSGAALVGIQFVVITLVADMRTGTSMEPISAFATPTVVHLAGALLVSAIMSAPWHSFFAPSLALLMYGLAGLAYAVVVVRRARRQTDYELAREDWLWYAVLPCVSYAALAMTAALLNIDPHVALFVVGAAALGLLVIGIHNAWDTVTYVVTTNATGTRQRAGDGAAQSSSGKDADVDIKRSGSQPSGRGPAEYFTGTVRIDPLFAAADPARAVGASVTFEPGARTAWHTHPLGQTLIVTAGCGRAQRWGGPVEDIRPGDVISFAPGEKHWHGAAPTTAVTHMAIQERLDGKTVDWMEKVSDEQYQGTDRGS